MNNFPFQVSVALTTLLTTGIVSPNTQPLVAQTHTTQGIPIEKLTAQASIIDQLWQEASELRGIGKYEEAIAILDQILKLQPNAFLAWYWRGNSYSNLGEYESAIASYEQAIKIKPDYLIALFEQGNSFYELKQYDAGIRTWKQALSIQAKSNYEEELITLIIPKRIAGTFLYDLRQYEEALSLYNQLISIEFKTASIWIDRGTAFYQLNRYEEAISNYDRAIKLEYYNALAWKRKGFALYRLERYEEAIASFETATKLQSDDLEVAGLLEIIKMVRESQSKIPALGRDLDTFLTELQTFQEIGRRELGFSRAFEEYLGITNVPIKPLSEILSDLRQIEQYTGTKPGILYSSFVSKNKEGETTDSRSKSLKQSLSENQQEEDDDQLELILVTADGKTIRKRIEGATRSQIREMTQKFFTGVTDIRNPNSYLEPAQKLYEWLVEPLEEISQGQKLTNLTFLMDKNLRSVPLAALHDGKGFLAERYSLGIMPSLALTNTKPTNLRNQQVLAMGAQEFPNQRPLPAVPIELSAIANRLWQGQSYLNEQFTIETLKQARQRVPYGIVHLATHAEFRPGKPSNSYIELWAGNKLRLDQLRQLQLDAPPVDLLVLSACRTALGNDEAELGFAGLAVQAGVKSAMGSLWYVSDEGTLALMTAFYKKLKEVPVKSEALRLAQVAMIRGDVRIEGGELVVEDERIPLPPELAKVGDRTFSHPYYWSAFTMIGNPW